MDNLRGQLRNLLITFSILISILGCATRPQTAQSTVTKMSLEEEIKRKQYAEISPSQPGSLWQANSQFNNLFIAIKARRVGDIVTVKIEESSKATNKANTQTGRKSSLQAGIDKLFGLEDWWDNHVLDSVKGDWPKPSPFQNPSVKGSMESKFDGQGTTSRSGDLTAFITCRVVEVLPNDILKIAGSREVMVNNETQVIFLTGIIRNRDISEENIVLSKYISDAKIAYSGSGIIDDRQRPGWLANLLNVVWPF